VTPFLQFRMWLRRGPAGERVASGIAAVVVLGLIAWAAVPVTKHNDNQREDVSASTPGGESTSTTVASGEQTGAPVEAAVGARPGQARDASTGVTGPSGTSGSATTANPCGDLRATDQGVTPTELHIAVILVSIQGSVGNSLVGVPGPEDQKNDFEAVIGAVNKAGGIACRKVVPSYHEANPIDASNQHAVCLDIVAEKAFAVLNVGAFNPLSNRDCLPQNKIPLIDVVPLPKSEADKFRPLLFSYAARYDHIFRNFARAASERHWYDGAKKIGLLEKSCDPEFNSQMIAELAEVGIARNRLNEFDFGCPPAVIPPNQIQQAVLQFKTSDVTHVIDVNSGSFTDFSKAAAQQQYRPKYGLPDAGNLATTQNPNNRPDPTMDGALAITPYAYGAENSGAPLGPMTDKCDAIMASAGLQPVVKQGVAMGGTVCSLVWLLQIAAEHAPVLTRTALMDGLNRAGKVDLSFPVGPADFSAPGTTYGGQFWRPANYVASCGCWKLLDQAWRPSF
jgi:hypothetical protein